MVENYRLGVLARVGFDDARLKALNPGLVIGSVNGFGSDGPYANRPAFDFIAQAMSGFLSMNDPADGPPQRTGAPVGDLVAGLFTAFGIVCELNGRDRIGGQRVEASLMDGLTSMLGFISAEFFATGKVPVRSGNDHPFVCPYGLFRAADGDVAIAPATPAIVTRLFKALDLLPLLEDPDFADNTARMTNRTRMNTLVNEKIGLHRVDYWIENLNAAGVPCGKVQDLAQICADPQLRAQDMILSVDHPGHGFVGMIGSPVKMSQMPFRVRLPAPELGADTDAVLRELGYDSARINTLRRNKVV